MILAIKSFVTFNANMFLFPRMDDIVKSKLFLPLEGFIANLKIFVIL